MVFSDETNKRYKGRSIDWLTDKAQSFINAFVRKRDSKEGYFICISCQDLKPVNQLNAGHYYAKEFYKSVRFDLDNIHSQCIRCNKYLSGNLIEYRKTLLDKIGKKKLDQLDQKSELKNFKYSRQFLIELIEKYKNV